MGAIKCQGCGRTTNTATCDMFRHADRKPRKCWIAFEGNTYVKGCGWDEAPSHIPEQYARRIGTESSVPVPHPDSPDIATDEIGYLDRKSSEGPIDAWRQTMVTEHQRPELTMEEVRQAVEVFEDALMMRLGEHGYGAFSSIHEVLGVVDEEHGEMKDAVRDNDLDQVAQELLDIAVPAVFGYACIKAKKIHQPKKKKK